MPDWLEKLNDIYQPQANVTFVHHSTRQVTIDKNLGPEVDSIDANSDGWEWDYIVKERDVGADINMFFVWKIVEFFGGGHNVPKAATWKKDCLMGDFYDRTPEQEIIVMAHEIGHAMGIPGDQHFYHPKNRNKYIMFFSSRFVGSGIPRVHANLVNP